MPHESPDGPLEKLAETPPLAPPAALADPGAAAAAAQGGIGRLWAWLVLLTMGVSWGLTFSLAKIAADGGAHPLGITFWQASLGAVFLGALTVARRRPIALDRRMLGLYAACALLGTVCPGILFFYAAAHVPAGVLSITVTLVPILTVFLAALLGVERLAAGRLLGVLCGMVAVVLLVAPQGSLPDPGAAPWVLAACAASACYAAENLVIALRKPAGASAFVVACGMYLVATLVMTPVVLATDSFVPLPLPWEAPWGPVEWSIVGMAAISAVAYSLFIYLVGAAGPVFASQTAYLVTLAGVLWGMAIFGEEHSLWIWFALIVMLAGLALVSPRRTAARLGAA
jgi:drug/metabolite transporter (DMT)-like permease